MKELKLKLIECNVYKECDHVDECMHTEYFDIQRAWEYVWDEIFFEADGMPPYEERDKVLSHMDANDVETYMPDAGKFKKEDILAMDKLDYETMFGEYIDNWEDEIGRYRVLTTTHFFPYNKVLENLVNVDTNLEVFPT